ncbi:MAG: carbohydrate ABC transporter permease [Clostridia bacterium]|nr:carbohydrate ABC transporter permease [Clostridia bacterium]
MKKKRINSAPSSDDKIVRDKDKLENVTAFPSDTNSESLENIVALPSDIASEELESNSQNTSYAPNAEYIFSTNAEKSIWFAKKKVTKPSDALEIAPENMESNSQNTSYAPIPTDLDTKKRFGKERIRLALLGYGGKRGLISTVVIYAMLILFGFVYVYPLLYMLAYSFMDASDVVNPLVNFFPSSLYWQNYSEAAQTLNFWSSLGQSMLVAILPSIAQTVATMLVAYGLSRFRFRGRKLIIGLVVLAFIVPQQITMFPQLLIFKKLHILDSLLSFIVPAALGQGIKSTIFILIFFQFFNTIPKSVEEAAKIDGAGAFKIFVKIGIPAALPAILLCFLLSVVWYYNETVLSAIYFGGEYTTLPLQLERFQATYESIFGTASTTGKSANEAIYMAGTLLSILPLIVIYAFTQRFFVEGIDKAGITGE